MGELRSWHSIYSSPLFKCLSPKLWWVYKNLVTFNTGMTQSGSLFNEKYWNLYKIFMDDFKCHNKHIFSIASFAAWNRGSTFEFKNISRLTINTSFWNPSCSCLLLVYTKDAMTFAFMGVPRWIIKCGHWSPVYAVNYSLVIYKKGSPTLLNYNSSSMFKKIYQIAPSAMSCNSYKCFVNRHSKMK